MESIALLTIHYTIKRFECGLPCDGSPRQGFWCKLDKKQRQKSKICAENNVGISHGMLALKLKVSNLPKLLAFIRKHHFDTKYIFWPGLATLQNVKMVAKVRKVPFLAKCIHTANVLKSCPIENFWTIFFDKPYNEDRTAVNQKHLVK